MFCQKLAALAFPAALLTFAYADEGMWTFDNPPLKQLKETYNFVPTQEWLDHVRLSSVRLNDGGSGSFVSAHGLLLTNHHVARGQLQKSSTADRDYIKNGKVQLIINTPTRKGPRTDEGKIRSLAVLNKVPIVTTITGASAAARAIEALQAEEWGVKPLQDYFAGAPAGRKH